MHPVFFLFKAYKDTGKAPVEAEVAIHRIRITLTSRNVKSLEKGKYMLKNEYVS